MLDKIKAHYERYETAYLVGAFVVVAGITYAITRRNVLHSGAGVSILHSGVTNTSSFVFKNKQTINVITVLERSGSGHPGYPVRNLETMQTFFKQAEAAKWANASESMLSSHLTRNIPTDINGLHFERVSLPTISG